MDKSEAYELLISRLNDTRDQGEVFLESNLGVALSYEERGVSGKFYTIQVNVESGVLQGSCRIKIKETLRSVSVIDLVLA